MTIVSPERVKLRRGGTKYRVLTPSTTKSCEDESVAESPNSLRCSTIRQIYKINKFSIFVCAVIHATYCYGLNDYWQRC